MKKIKNITKILFIIIPVLILFTTGCQKVEQKEEEKTTNPLFYKITNKENDTEIYLLGSIHAADETAYPLNKKIMDAFSKSEFLAVEVDTIEMSNDLNLQIQLAQKMMYNDGTTIKDHLGEELYNSMVELLESKNSYNSLYDNYKPIFFESLFQNTIIEDANMNANDGIDMHFLKLAKENNKKILEVESAEFQYDLLLSFPDELEILFLKDYIDNYDDSVTEMRNLYEKWKEGNLTELENLLTTEDYSEYTEEEQKLLEDYNNALVYDRNYNMANILDSYMKEEKNVFCVVGLAHVIGEDGIINLMQKKGYIIEEIK